MFSENKITSKVWWWWWRW